MISTKTFEYYMSLPYTVVLQESPEGGFVAKIAELPGCLAQGETEVEALAMLEDTKAGLLYVALQDTDYIPEPKEVTNAKASASTGTNDLCCTKSV